MIALAPHLFELFRFAERNLKSFPYDTWVDYASWMINVRKLLWRKDREDRTGKLKSRNTVCGLYSAARSTDRSTRAITSAGNGPASAAATHSASSVRFLTPSTNVSTGSDSA